jgi:phosphatidylethanolamine-binding protein (PEBP) family uncharacterized protein
MRQWRKRQPSATGAKVMALTITSAAFDDGGAMASRHTCEGLNILTDELLAAMKGHLVGQAQIVGTYRQGQ